MVGFLKSLLATRWERQREAKAIIDKGAAVPRLSQKMGVFGHCPSLDGVLGSDVIMEALVLVLMCHSQSGPSDGVL